MPLKTVVLPHSGRTVKMGRLRPEPPPKPPLRFESFLGAVALPTPPASVDYAPKGQPALSDVYGNDQLGDCVVAGGYHVLATWTGNAGQVFTATRQQVVADYSAIGGYVPGRPDTDRGCDEVSALRRWVSPGFASGDQILGWLPVDASNSTLLRQAAWLFENLYFGVQLPDAWLNPPPQRDGFVWDVAGPPDPNNGHCFIGVGFTDRGVLIDTWGMVGTLTWAAAARYATQSSGGEVYVLVGPQILPKAQRKAPNGVDWAPLIGYFDALGGNLPIPSQPPVPVPAPPPGPGPGPDPVNPPAPAPPPSPFPANSVVLDLGHAHVSVPPGVTPVLAIVPQVTYYPFRRQIGVPPGWTCASHQGVDMTPESIEAAIGEHLPEAPEAPHPHSAAAAVPPEAWLALAQALGPIVTPVVQAILNRFNHRPAPAPAAAPAPPP